MNSVLKLIGCHNRYLVDIEQVICYPGVDSNCMIVLHDEKVMA